VRGYEFTGEFLKTTTKGPDGKPVAVITWKKAS